MNAASHHFSARWIFPKPSPTARRRNWRGGDVAGDVRFLGQWCKRHWTFSSRQNTGLEQHSRFWRRCQRLLARHFNVWVYIWKWAKVPICYRLKNITCYFFFFCSRNRCEESRILPFKNNAEVRVDSHRKLEKKVKKWGIEERFIRKKASPLHFYTRQLI